VPSASPAVASGHVHVFLSGSSPYVVVAAGTGSRPADAVDDDVLAGVRDRRRGIHGPIVRRSPSSSTTRVVHDRPGEDPGGAPPCDALHLRARRTDRGSHDSRPRRRDRAGGCARTGAGGRGHPSIAAPAWRSHGPHGATLLEEQTKTSPPEPTIPATTTARGQFHGRSDPSSTPDGIFTASRRSPSEGSWRKGILRSNHRPLPRPNSRLDQQRPEPSRLWRDGSICGREGRTSSPLASGLDEQVIGLPTAEVRWLVSCISRARDGS
jgi:hypothetical protein